MNKSASIAIKVAIFAVIASMGIYYILKTPAVEEVADYEKQEMVKPNRGKSMVDQFFSTVSGKENSSDGDNVSLTGESGRYDEVRIGKSGDQ